MKKITLSLFSFLLSPFFLCVQAQQQLPDGSFETGWTWTNGQNGPFWEYKTNYFYTLNSLFDLEPTADRTADRVGNAQHGDWCIELKSGRVAVGTDYVFLPGMVGTISEGFVGEFIGSGGEVKITRDWAGYETPKALEGWYKYRPAPGDSALIDIGFYYEEFTNESFVEKLIIKETVNEWTHFRITIPEKYWNKYFAEIRVLFVASAGVNFENLMECKGQLGSTLWIDNISLKYELGIKQNLFSTLKAKAFPNPAAEVLNIELNEYFSGKVVVYNSLGSLVMEENITGLECSLNTAALANGNYIYKLMEGNTIWGQGKFVVVK